MKFSCEAQVLLGGLSIVTRVLSARTTQPILEGVLVKTTDEGLQLTCSDGAISVLTTVPAQISEEGTVVMPGKLFLDVVRKMPQAQLKVTVNEHWVAKLSSQGVRMTLSGQAGELYPSLPLVSAENSFVLPNTFIRTSISQTTYPNP